MYRSSRLRGTFITGLDMCKVCTEAVGCVALSSQVWTCVKYVPKQCKRNEDTRRPMAPPATTIYSRSLYPPCSCYNKSPNLHGTFAGIFCTNYDRMEPIQMTNHPPNLKKNTVVEYGKNIHPSTPSLIATSLS